MVRSDGSVASDRVAERVRGRLRYGTIAANAAGGLVVFVFIAFALPRPDGVKHPVRLLALNAGVFAACAAVSFPLASMYLMRIWKERVGWASSMREPSERERELTLRFPLTQQLVIGVLWVLAALVFAALNAPFSVELAANAAVTIVLGGLVTAALGYLFSERLLRPITALALDGAVPARPQLPGVAARALLSWTLGTAVVLLGLALVGIGGLSEDRFSRQRLSIIVLVLSVAGIAVGFAITLALARSLADPIEALRRAVGRVEQGDLEHGVAVDDGSEIGLLQAGFNQMLAGLRERERLRDLFGRQVGEDAVRHGLEHGVKLGGEAREAAVLFVDLRGSTALAETRDPTEVVSLLNGFFAIVVEVVAAHGGWVNKFEGDAALCVFGAPLPDAQAASHALRAARLLAGRLCIAMPQIAAGIGVSAGRVVAGNIGAARRFEYTVIGDPVNEAARLTELAKRTPEHVLASDAALSRADPEEAGRWLLGSEVTLRGRSAATAVAAPL
jgi:adenylate cyclase